MRPSFQAALLFCLGLTTAAPVAESVAERDIAATQFSQFTLFSQYAGSSYCYGNVHGAANSKISCSGEGGSCPLVEAASTSIVTSFQLGDTKTLGYVAVDDTNKLIVISIQGTQVGTNIIDVWTDIDFVRNPTSICGSENKADGCEVHTGFMNAATDVLSTVEADVATAIKAHPDYKVISTGHSLGGAVAALIGAQLRNNGTNTDIYTFGQPSVGSADISNYIQSQAPAKGANYRVTHGKDIVPQLPPHIDPLGNADWDHFYPEYYISLESGTPTASDINEVTGSLYETAGNQGQSTNIIIGTEAHLLYIGSIASCNSAAP